MIFDNLSNIKKYKGIKKNLDIVIDYITSQDLNNFDFGQHDVDSNNFFKKMDQECLIFESAPYELHEKYADIHIILDDKSELVGFKPISELGDAKVIEDLPHNDVKFVKSDIKNVVELDNKKFILFMPGEGHAPKIKNGHDRVTKVIFKVKW